MGIVPDRAVREIFDRYITAQLAVDAFEQVEVEGRGDPGRVVIGGDQRFDILDPVDADQQQRPFAERGAPVTEQVDRGARDHRSEEHTSELQSLMRISYAVFCLKKKKPKHRT